MRGSTATIFSVKALHRSTIACSCCNMVENNLNSQLAIISGDNLLVMVKSGKVTGDESNIIYPTFHMLVVSTFSRIEEMRKKKTII